MDDRFMTNLVSTGDRNKPHFGWKLRAALSTPRPLKKLWEAEKDHVLLALTHTAWNITHTAELLGISPTTLRKKIVDYGLR